jgi:hypothetical protein
MADDMGPPVPYRHTSVKTDACHSSSAAMTEEFNKRDLAAKQCPAVENWSLFVVYSEALSWVEIARDQRLWSTQNQVAIQSQLGRDPHVSSDGVRWLPGQGAVHTLMFNMEAQEDPTPNGPGKRVTRYAIVKLEGSEPVFCGFAKSEEEAKKLADNRETCTAALKQYPYK